jgi:hypothetical protein
MHQHMTKKYLLFLVFITTSIISCNTAKLMVDGKTAYNSMQYAVAADLLQKELSALKTTEEKYGSYSAGQFYF